MTPITFYLSRNTEVYGGSYNLSTYHPKQNSHGTPCWCFWGGLNDVAMTSISRDTAIRLLAKAGLDELKFGTCLNLSTGEILTISQAECM